MISLLLNESISIVFILVIFICLDQVQAQFVDSIQMSEITISTFKDKQVSRSSFNIRSLSLDSLCIWVISILLECSRIPGVTILSTGLHIQTRHSGTFGKPGIILIAGLKFDNQQWQEEHGLGLSDLGLSRIELIKDRLVHYMVVRLLVSSILMNLKQKKIPKNKICLCVFIQIHWASIHNTGLKKMWVVIGGGYGLASIVMRIILMAIINACSTVDSRLIILNTDTDFKKEELDF